MEPLRLIGPLVLALVSATAVDQLMSARGLLPPGFREPARRLLGSMVIAGVLYVGVFAALGQVGLARGPMPAQVPPAQLFVLHAIFVLGLFMWLLLAFAGCVPQGSSLGTVVLRQLGLAPSRPLIEVVIGLLLSPLVWVLLVGCLLVVMAMMFTFGVQDLLPKQPPALVLWLAGLPLWLKVSVALSAGVVEEIFFRGLLQPRVGIAVSTLLFVLAHLSYDQPFMLVGVTVLSLVFAGLVWWRQNVWPAIVAHFLFDAVQLLFVIPWALEQWPSGAKALAPVAGVALAMGGVPWLP